MEKVIEFLTSWLKTAPKWVKVAVPLGFAGLIAIYLLSSCSAIRQMEVERRQTREVKDTTTVRLVTSVYKRSVVTRTPRLLAAFTAAALASALLAAFAAPNTAKTP